MKMGSTAVLVFIATFALGTSATDAAGKSKKRAKSMARKAAKAFKKGNFNLALGFYQEAYNSYSSPRLLFNIGQCHLSLKNYDAAIQNFEDFLRDEPDTPHKQEVQRLIDEAKKEAAGAEGPPPKAAEPVPEPKAAKPVADTPEIPKLEKTPPKEPKPQLVAKPKQSPKDPDPVHEQWWFWTIIGGVAVAGASAAIIVASSGGETRTALPSGTIGVLDRRGP